MNLKLFSRPGIFIVCAVVVLMIASLACGAMSGGAPAPAATEPAASEAPATEAPAATEPPAAEATEPPEAESTQPVAGTAVVPPPVFASTPTAQPQPAMNESRRLTLEFPPQIRLGEGDIIRLTLEVDDLGNITPTAAVEGNVISGETIEIPNLYETHNVTAEARLDLAGVEVKPSDLISEPLTQGQSVTFYWSIRPQEVGVYRGTIWLYLRFVEKSNGEESRKTVSAQMVEIEAVNLLGLPLGMVRVAGAAGSVVGGVLGFPFLEDIIRIVFRRRKRP